MEDGVIFIGSKKTKLCRPFSFSQYGIQRSNGGRLRPQHEYVKRGNLRSYLIQNPNPSFETIIRFALDIAKALSYLHSEKLILRNVKIDNMLLGKNLKVKIDNFGLTVFEPEDVLVRLGIVGPSGCMAPEVQADEPYGCKADVYSYGICLLEIYYYAKAYEIDEHMRYVIPEEYCPRSLGLLIERCLELDPKKRPEMKEVVLELEAIAAAESKASLIVN